jgi:phosphoglycerol transferase MdoB-like AlkP superfamily enzyme
LRFGTTFIVYLLLALFIEAAAKPRGRFVRRPIWSVVAAVLTLTMLYATWFSVSWRPIFSTVAALITLITVVLISDYKFRNVLEPLNFMDFALIPQIWRHPALYQAPFLHHPIFFAAVAMLLAIIAAWWVFLETSILPAGHPWIAAGSAITIVAVILAWFFRGPLPHSLISFALRRMLPPDSARHVREFGLAASLTAGLIAWHRAVTSSREWASVNFDTDRKSPIVVVVQSESFVDIRGCGLHDVMLPAFYDAQSRSSAHGRISVPVQGAWTLRSEFAFLTGQPLERFGLSSLHPYLRLQQPPRTIAHHLRDAGFSTVFVHPFDMAFFNRDKALPKLGFDRLVDETAFSTANREGYYISDAAVANNILALADAEKGPFFCFATTMENHNPWDKGRLDGIEGPVNQFVHHLRNADRMIASLVGGIERMGRPAVLAFYGDHVPTMPELADPFPDPRTDYFVMGFTEGRWVGGSRRDLELHQLPDLILAVLQQIGAKQAKIA